MVREASIPIDDFTLANWIAKKVETHPLFDCIITSDCGDVFKNLIQEFNSLPKKDGNNTEFLLSLLQECSNNLKTSADESIFKRTQSLLNEISQELSEVNQTIVSLGIAINSAHDAYTLYKTTIIINSLSATLDEVEKEQGKFSHKKQPISYLMQKGSLGFTQQKKTNHPEWTAHKQVAEDLQNLLNACEDIRSLIGSPDSMPKGLIIHLVKHLSQAISEIHKVADPFEGSIQPLLKSLEKELESIRKHFPELAKAGEKLQDALAKASEDFQNTNEKSGLTS